MKILDGKKISEEIAEGLSSRLLSLSTSSYARKPKLAIIQIGHVPESDVYINMKVKYAKKIGADAEVLNFDESITEEELLQKILDINEDDSVHGVIVQLPIPDHINIEKVLNAISPEKDVDGLGAVNISKLVRGPKSEKGMVPATARGVIDLLKAYDVNPTGKKVVIVGRSVLVGKSVALNFLNHDATVSICHSKTQNLEEITSAADILVSAAGTPRLIGLNHVNPNQVLVDVSISVDDNGKIVGDVDAKVLETEAVSAVSPVPGGVGPMTVASLFQNLVETYYNQSISK